MLPRRTCSGRWRSRPDVLPCIVLPAAAGFADHGSKLLELLRQCGSDFEDMTAWTLPATAAGRF